MKKTIVESLSFIFCISIMLFGVYLVFRFGDGNYDSFEKECVVFYKENHYITKDCEEYRDKLLQMEV